MMSKLPFVLSLSKDSLRAHRSHFDKRSTNGVIDHFPPCAKHGEGDHPQDGGGASRFLTSFGPSVTPSACHLPKAALQGGNI